MTLKAGSIVEGKVVNITNFGAFVEVEGKQDLFTFPKYQTFCKRRKRSSKRE